MSSDVMRTALRITRVGGLAIEFVGVLHEYQFLALTKNPIYTLTGWDEV